MLDTLQFIKVRDKYFLKLEKTKKLKKLKKCLQFKNIVL